LWIGWYAVAEQHLCKMLWSWSCGRLKTLWLRICGNAVSDQHFLTNCGDAVAEVLLQVAEVRLRQKKICTCPPLLEVTIHNTRVHCASYLGWTVYTTWGSVFINWVHCGLCTAHGVPCVHQLQFNVYLICSLSSVYPTWDSLYTPFYAVFHYGHLVWFIVITTNWSSFCTPIQVV
jgi:hypothetical protein